MAFNIFSKSENENEVEMELESVKENGAELKETNVQIEKLQKQLNAYACEISDLKEMIEDYEKEIGKLESQIKNEKEKCEKTVLAIEKEKAELERKEILLKSREQETKNLASQNDKKFQELAKKEVKLNSREQEIERKESSLAEELANMREKAVVEIADKREKAAGEIIAIREKAIAESTAAAQKIAAKQEQAEKELFDKLTQEYSRKVQEFTEKLSVIRQDAFDKMLKDVESEHNKRIESINSEIQGKLAEITAEKETVIKLKNEAASKLEDLNAKIEVYEGKLENVELKERRLKARANRLDERETNLDNELKSNYQQLIKSHENDISVLEEECQNLRDQLKSVVIELEGYDSLKLVFGDNPKTLDRRLKDLEKQNSELLKEISERPQNIVETQFKDLKVAHDDLLVKYEELSRKYEDTKQDIIKINQITQERDILQNANHSNESRIAGLEEELKHARAEIVRLSSVEGREADREARIATITSGCKELEGVINPSALVSQGYNEIEWLRNISLGCKEYGISFPKRILYAFHTALKIADWSTITVLAGVSGTGKSELPRLYSALGRINFINVPVQPNWDSQESMLGYFNSIDNKFEAQEVLKFLAECAPEKDAKLSVDKCVNIVLLDEMNLAHVEYYFAEFLSKLEQRRGLAMGNEPAINVKLGAGIDPYPIKLKRNILWCGTMNQDETTKSLSDKVLDRGLVINFPRPKALKSREKMANLTKFLDAKFNVNGKKAPMLNYATWSRWVQRDTNILKKGAQRDELDRLKKIVQDINDYLGNIGRALGHRVWQSIEFYIINYPEVIAAIYDENGNEKNPNGELSQELKAAMGVAFEDQLVQKVMPKLRGIDTKGRGKDKCLVPIRELLERNNFNIINDFDKACQLGYGQFIWCSAEYIPDEIAGEEDIEKQELVDNDKNE